MVLVKAFNVQELLTFRGYDLSAALGAAARFGPMAWTFATPVPDTSVDFKSSKFYRTVIDNVDDDEKLGHFGTMMAGLARAATQSNFSELLVGYGVDYKRAWDFKAHGSMRRLWELKHGKKDRVYLYPITIEDKKAFIFLQAEHKKDQTTPKHVKAYCEPMIKALVNPADPPKFC
jgi:hypothetical protein